MELVKSRRSVRTFDGKAPDKEEVRDLLKYADEAFEYEFEDIVL